MVQFEKATRKKAKARIGIAGPSGSGKSYSALAIASGLGDNVFVLDTERDSAQLYADEFDFLVASLDAPHDPKKYQDAINAAVQAGADVLIIDSLSHAWQRVLEIVDQEKANSRNPHQLAAWAVASPMWRNLIDAILVAPVHVIVTMRSKTEWAVGDGNKPEKIGLAPEARAGIEYEFTLFGEINHRHFMQITKSRITDFQDRSIEKPGAEVGASIIGWLNSGADQVLPPWLDELCNTYGEGETLDAINVFRAQSDLAPFVSVMQVRPVAEDRVALLKSYLQDQFDKRSEAESGEGTAQAEGSRPEPTASNEGASPDDTAPPSTDPPATEETGAPSLPGDGEPSGSPDPRAIAERAKSKQKTTRGRGRGQTKLGDGAEAVLDGDSTPSSQGAAVEAPSSDKAGASA